MKNALMLAAALATLTSIPAMARQADAATQQTASMTAVANPLTAVGKPRPQTLALIMRQMRVVKATLMGSLDSKSARIGREVELRTKEPMVSADGTAIPKGSKIMGHITAVEAHGKENADAAVAIEFDRAELKGGLAVPILSEIRWIEPPPDPSTAAMMQRVDSMGGGVMGNATSVQGGAQTGGLGTGTSGGMTVSGGMIQMTPKQQQGLSSAADYGVEAPPQDQANSAAELGVGLTAGNRAVPHQTGVRGVLLAGNDTGTISGTFLASGQNVHLDGGSQLLLGIIAVKP
jgi:hypothetical protein